MKCTCFLGGELPWLPKQVRATRGRFVPDVQTVHKKDKILNIVIKYGWKEGTGFIYPNG